MTTILALDLSLTATGVVHPDGTLETWTPPKGLDPITRLAWFGDHVDETPEPHLAVIEDLPHGLRNAAAGPLGEFHGVTKLLLRRRQISMLLIPPATLKKYATGKGNATKPDMRMELYKRTGLDVPDDNQVDAWWLRALALDLAGAPILAMPATHRAALAKLTLPEGPR